MSRLRNFYTDEGRNHGTDLAGVAIIETTEEIPDAVVNRALSELPPESRARERGWFHASKDGTPERMAFGHSIRTHVSGRLHVAMLDRSAEAAICELFERTRETEVPYQAALWAAYLVARLDPSDVRIIVEHRSGFSIERAQEWLVKADELWQPLLEQAPHAGPTHSPKIEIHVLEKASKPNPGLQVVDLLLWAYNRQGSTGGDLFHQVVPKPAIQSPDLSGTHLKLFELQGSAHIPE